ncbi:MAG TPA: TolC family protein [Kofleriaceae bacterium]|jgi:outer membrane protein TolC
MKALVSAVVLCGLVGAAHADDKAPVRALLAAPEQLASWLRDRDPVMEAQRAKVVAAQAASSQARVIPNPSLSLGVANIPLGRPSANGTDDGTGMHESTSAADTLIYNATLEEQVELGKRGPRKAAADLRVREAGLTAQGTLGGKVNDVEQALGKLAYVTSRKAVLTTNLAAATQLMGLEKVRLDHKDLSPLEFARIELDTADVARQLTRAEADLATAVATCNAALYAECALDGLDDPAVLDGGAPLPPTMPGTDEAIEARPERAATHLEIQALNKDADLAHARRIPDPTFGLGYTYDRFNESGDLRHSLLFSVAIPLGIFDTGAHDAAAARANAHAAEATERAEVREAKGQVEALFAQRKTLEMTLTTLERDQVPKSAQIIEQTRKAFDLGQATLGDLLLVERAHRDLLLEVLDTRFDLFNVRASLREQLGLDDQAARTP